MITAKELMDQLSDDLDYQKMVRTRDREHAYLTITLAADEKEMLKELSQIGYDIASVWDFVNSENDYYSAVPILIRHLKLDHHYRILAGIARALAIRDLEENDELWNVLVDRYKTVPPDKDIDIPSQRGAQMALGLAIAELTTKERVQVVRSLIKEYPHSDGVSWFKEAISSNMD